MKKVAYSLLLIFFSASAGAAGKIELRSELLVSEPKMISLGDVAQFTDIDSSWIKEIEKVDLGRAPQLGEKHSYTSVFLSSLLRKALAKVPTDVKDKWVIRIPTKVTISNHGYRVDSAIIEEKLSSHWKNICSGCKFLITNLITPQVPQELQKFSWEMKLGDDLPRGQFAVSLEIRDDHGQPHLFWVRGQAQIQQEIPVTTRAINFGERLTANDFKLQWKDVTFAYDSAPSPAALVGRRVSRSLRNAEPIFSGILEKEKAMKRGDLVKLVLSDDNWRIVMNGVAEEDGFVGDTIKVRNKKTKKQISGVVSTEGEVIVR